MRRELLRLARSSPSSLPKTTRVVKHIMPPQIDVYVTSVLLSAKLRGAHDRVQRYLVGARVPFATHDVASSEEAKLEWKRMNRGNNELPCIIVNGEPVGTVEQLDEAVEFGALRQFLRLDEDAPPSTTEETPPPPPPASEKPILPQATLDDFASLNLTPEELAQLEAELSSGQTHSLPDAPPPKMSSHGFATKVHDVAPLKLHRSDIGADGERIDYKRVGDYSRPIRQDASTDLEVLDGVDEDELEKLAKELEEEESRSKPSLPPKDDVVIAPGSNHELPDSLKQYEGVEGDGGAALSQPLDQIQQLSLSPEEVKYLEKGPKELEVHQPGQLELAAVAASKYALKNPTADEHPSASVPISERSKKIDIAELKKGLHQGYGLMKAKEVEVEPGVGVPSHVVRERSAELVDEDEDFDVEVSGPTVIEQQKAEESNEQPESESSVAALSGETNQEPESELASIPTVETTDQPVQKASEVKEAPVSEREEALRESVTGAAETKSAEVEE